MISIQKTLLNVFIAILLFCIASFVLYQYLSHSPVDSSLSPIEADSTKLITGDSYKIGDPNALVTLVEFGDYQCPACATIHPIIKKIISQYTGKIYFVYRNFPLSQHINGPIAAQAAECAGSQGKFWEMYDRLYENQDEWSLASDPKPIFQKYAQDLNLDIQLFTSDLQSHKFIPKINTDITDGNSLGVNSTPTFFINNHKYTGVLSYQGLRQAIEASLSGSTSN